MGETRSQVLIVDDEIFFLEAIDEILTEGGYSTVRADCGEAALERAAEPEIGVSYDVGAIYFRSTSTFGDPEVDRLREHPSYVTVRIFNRGTPLVELVGKELTSGFELWHVARVTWCEGDGCPQVDIIDELYAEGEYNLP